MDFSATTKKQVIKPGKVAMRFDGSWDEEEWGFTLLVDGRSEKNDRKFTSKGAARRGMAAEITHRQRKNG